MQSSSERIADVLNAWHAVIGDNEITSSQILKRTADGAQRDPAVRKLRDALQALFPCQQLNPQRLGMWLAKHRGSESGDLRLSGDYNSNKSRWHWYVLKVASIEQIESELAESAQRFVEARENKLAGKGLDRRLKQLEKDQVALDALDEQRRAAESDRKYKERVKFLAPNSPTPKQIKQAKCYVLVPRGTSRFSREASANLYEQKVRQLGYTADVIFHRQGGYAIRLFDVDRSDAGSIARTVVLSVVEIKNRLKFEGKKTVIESDTDLPAIGYFPEQKFLERALVEDHARVHRPTPFLGFEWKIFD